MISDLYKLYSRHSNKALLILCSFSYLRSKKLMDCPKCNSTEKIKNGIVNTVQRYKCKCCSYNYTVSQRSGEYSKAVKRQALHLYLEGLGFRSIGRILNVSNVSILNWIRAFGKELKDLQSDSQEIEFVELDEMHSYIGNKKTIVGYGLLLIDMENDFSTSLLVTEADKQLKDSGNP